jgi:peptide subunit release factor RF-3
VPSNLKLDESGGMRDVPIITFVNKLDVTIIIFVKKLEREARDRFDPLMMILKSTASCHIRRWARG